MADLLSRLSACRITFRSNTSPILRSRCSSSMMMSVGSICRIGVCLLPRCFLAVSSAEERPVFSPSLLVVVTGTLPL